MTELRITGYSLATFFRELNVPHSLLQKTNEPTHKSFTNVHIKFPGCCSVKQLSLLHAIQGNTFLLQDNESDEVPLYQRNGTVNHMRTAIKQCHTIYPQSLSPCGFSRVFTVNSTTFPDRCISFPLLFLPYFLHLDDGVKQILPLWWRKCIMVSTDHDVLLGIRNTSKLCFVQVVCCA